LTLLILQLKQNMSPNWYYVSGALSGLINWFAVALSSISDVMPPKWRAPSFGLFLAGFFSGLAVAPSLALAMGHFNVSLLSFLTALGGLIVAVLFLPETLSPFAAAEAQETRLERIRIQSESQGGLTVSEATCSMLLRPLRELAILNRNRIIRTLALLAFFTGVVSSGDQSLLVYYVEERLAFTDRDIAKIFLLIGLLGILVQGVLLKLFNDCIGEKRVVIFSFLVSAFHNVLYGVAKSKRTIFIAAAIAPLSNMAFPTISALKSNNVRDSEQGLIQGALYSLQAIASGLGPMIMRAVYHFTKDGAFFGAGSMFVVAGGIMMIAVGLAHDLPEQQTGANVELYERLGD
jgi:Major Facilitator Superfamily